MPEQDKNHPRHQNKKEATRTKQPLGLRSGRKQRCRNPRCNRNAQVDDLGYCERCTK